jgi:hypothetical protein
VRELLIQWVIEAQLGPQTRQCFRIRPLSDHRLNRISRRDVKEEERHQEDAKQRGKKEKQPLKEEATHRVRSACIHR